jgi:MFS family permease
MVTAAYSFFPIAGVVLAIRFINGFAFGISTTSSTTIASDIIPRKRFGEGMGYFSLSISLGLALAPALGLAVFEMFDFQITTFTAAALIVIAVGMSIFIRSPKSERRTAPRRLSPYERSAIAPSVVMLFSAIPNGAVLGFISLYAASIGVADIGFYFTVCAISMLLTRPLFGRAIDRFGFNIAVFPGLAMMAGGMLFVAGASDLMHFLFGGALLGTGYGAIQTALQTMSLINAPRERFGAANATFFTGIDGGVGIGSVLGGVLSGILGYSAMYLVLSAGLLVAAAAYLIFARNISKKEFPDSAEAPGAD